MTHKGLYRQLNLTPGGVEGIDIGSQIGSLAPGRLSVIKSTSHFIKFFHFASPDKFIYYELETGGSQLLSENCDIKTVFLATDLAGEILQIILFVNIADLRDIKCRLNTFFGDQKYEMESDYLGRKIKYIMYISPLYNLHLAATIDGKGFKITLTKKFGNDEPAPFVFRLKNN